MRLYVPDSLPAIDALHQEQIRNIYPKSSIKADPQSKPLRILLLNLMPLKEATEIDFARLLAQTESDIELTLLRIQSHKPKNTPIEHLKSFYNLFSEIENSSFDGFIVTGAPIELLSFEEVTYWNELRLIFDWSLTHTRSALYICWGAQAALNHFYGIPKYKLPQKMFGIFEHEIMLPEEPLVAKLPSPYLAPHSRHTEVIAADILRHPQLQIVSQSPIAGVNCIKSNRRNDFYLTGHAEYACFTLDSEYRRDQLKGMNIQIPHNYYPQDNPENTPTWSWHQQARQLFSNWVKFYL